MNMKIYIKTYGCSANQSNSEIMAGLLKKEGYELTDFENSDLVIINTCTVKLPTEMKILNKLKELSKTNKKIIISGCMPLVQLKEIRKTCPKASIIGLNIEDIIKIVKKIERNEKIILVKRGKRPKVCIEKVRRNPVISITQISEGCLGNCAYCIVKLIKGKINCFPPELILKDIKKSLKDGCKEIWITSQDNAAYDFNGLKLPELLNEITKIKGNFRVRIGMMNPKNVLPILNELIDAYKSEKIFKFLHLPVQSGSNKVLKLMGRGYKIEDFLKIVKAFRKEFPKLTLSTDIIVGFPGETKKDFEKSIKLIEKTKPDIVNLSKFGPRPGTKAEKMEKIPEKEIKKRSAEIAKIINKIKIEKNKEWVDWEGEILIDEKGTENSWVGRNFAYKPIIIKSNKNLLGKFVRVKVLESKLNYLVGFQIN